MICYLDCSGLLEATSLVRVKNPEGINHLSS